MNRIQLCDDDTSNRLCPSALSPAFSPHRTVETGPVQFWYPEKYERHYAYPLIVWLHGGGADHRQLSVVMPHISCRNYAGVAPCGMPGPWGAHAANSVHLWTQTTDGIEQALDAVFGAITRAESKFHIAPHRIFLAGWADGGTMALRIGLTHPQSFAGVASLNGPMPCNQLPIRRFHETRGTRFFLGYGKESELYPAERVAQDVRLLHALGPALQVVQFNTNDCPTEEMFSFLNRWFMAIVTGETERAERAPSLASLVRSVGSN